MAIIASHSFLNASKSFTTRLPKNVEPSFESFNLEKYDGKGLDLDTVFQAATVMPMMSDKRCLVEVKGVTLEFDGECYFPDAPTERGVKHINELIAAKEEGYETYIFFVVQMKDVKFLSPNDATHAELGDALRKAAEKGVNIMAYDCYVEPDLMEIREKIPVIL